MIRYLLVVALVVAAFMGLRRAALRLSLSQKQFNLLLVLVTALVVVVVLIMLGRVPAQFILAPITLLLTFMLRNLPLMIQLFPLFQKMRTRSAYGSAGPQQDTSSIRTRFLAMQLQHDSGQMDGEVLEGRLKGARLSNLSVEQLLELAQECRVDNDSLQILEAYLDRHHADWRQRENSAGGSATGTGEAMMTREMALDILGLPADASRDQVVQAHRRLMQKMHPDRGGSDYLAQKINAARDFLLGE